MVQKKKCFKLCCLTKFHDDGVNHTKIMAILSTRTSRISNVSIETYRKEIAVILNRIDQIPQNLARVQNSVGSFDRSHKNFSFFILPIVSIVFYCLSIVCRLFQV